MGGKIGGLKFWQWWQLGQLRQLFLKTIVRVLRTMIFYSQDDLIVNRKMDRPPNSILPPHKFHRSVIDNFLFRFPDHRQP